MNSLREQCKERLKVAFDSIRAISGSLTFILVVDDTSLKVLSSTIKMMELVNYGINSVERLELSRKKFKKIEAVYLIHPSSFELLFKDYEGAEAQYNSIHILSLTKIPAHIMDQLSNHAEIVKRVKTLKEINFSFCIHNDNEFIVERAGQNYSKDSLVAEGVEGQNALNTTVDQLATVLTSLSEFYIVEILYSPASTTNMAEKLAFELKEKLEKMFDIYSKFSVQNYTSSAPQTTFLILDRNFDAITPLMRDFYYLPLLYDNKQAYKHKIELGKDKKTYSMDENDSIFEKYKYTHIEKTLHGITADFENFSQTHIGARVEKGDGADIGLDKMRDMMKKIPQYTELKERYSFHIQMATDIMKSFKEGNYRAVGELEQSLASHTSENGKSIKSSDLFGEAMKVIPEISDETERARVLLISLLTLDLKPKQKTALLDMLKKCDNYSEIYQNFTQKLVGPLLYRMGPKKAGGVLDRHQTKIEEIVKKMQEGGQAELKFLRIGTESRGKNPVKAMATLGRKKIGSPVDKAAKPRLIVFVCSGISYAEMRALSQFQSDYHIIYGSHSFVTQTQFMELMNSLSGEEL